MGRLGRAGGLSIEGGNAHLPVNGDGDARIGGQNKTVWLGVM